MEQIFWTLLKIEIFIYLASFFVFYMITMFKIKKCKNKTDHKFKTINMGRYQGIGGEYIEMQCEVCHKKIKEPQYVESLFRKILLILILLTSFLNGTVIILEWLQII